METLQSWRSLINFDPCSYIWPTSDEKAQQSEWKLLEKLKNIHWPHISKESPNDSNFKIGNLRQVKISEKDYINTLSIEENDSGEKKVLVMTHGYGNGLGHYFQNYQPLVDLKGWNIYSIDWLGMGRSSRPKFNLRRRKGQTELDHVHEAEDFFVESLEKWRQEMGLEKFHLLGHSLGGYLSTIYSLRYPERVEKLILASPVGIPQSPFLPDNSDEGKLRAASQQQQIDSPMVNNELNQRPKVPFWVPYAWNNLHITPQYLVRLSGPYGPKLVSYYAERRFSHLEKEQKDYLQDYLYHISSMKGSGEYALGSILSFGAYARHPLRERITKLKVPLTFIYGEIDWMDYRHALKLRNNFQVPVKLHVLPQVGHQLFLEKPENFNEFLIKELNSKPSDKKFETNIDAEFVQPTQ